MKELLNLIGPFVHISKVSWNLCVQGHIKTLLQSRKKKREGGVTENPSDRGSRMPVQQAHTRVHAVLVTERQHPKVKLQSLGLFNIFRHLFSVFRWRTMITEPKHGQNPDLALNFGVNRTRAPR